jgi:hypothetical protein
VCFCFFGATDVPNGHGQQYAEYWTSGESHCLMPPTKKTLPIVIQLPCLKNHRRYRERNVSETLRCAQINQPDATDIAAAIACQQQRRVVVGRPDLP